MSKRGVVAWAVLLLVLSVLGCTRGVGRPVQEVTATADAHGVQHVRLDAHSFYFEPNRIVVKANQPVELSLRNRSFMVPHNFTVSSPDGALELKKGVGMFHSSTTYTFTPTKPGEYTFFCSKHGHMAKGMSGTLVVQ